MYIYSEVKMKKIQRMLFDRFTFLVAFLISSLIFTLPFLIDYQKYNKLFLVWGFLLLMHDFFHEKSMFKNKGKIFLWIFTVGYTCTLLFNVGGFEISDWSRFAYFFLHYFLMNSYLPNIDKEKIKRQMLIFCNVYIIPVFILVLISVVMFTLGTMISYTSTFGGEPVIYTMGVYQHTRLQGTFSNPNELGIAALISIMCSVLCMDTLNNKRFNKLYIINVVFCYIALAWSMSRTTVALLMGYSFLSYFLKKVFNNKKINVSTMLKNFIIGLCLALAILVGTLSVVKMGNGIVQVREYIRYELDSNDNGEEEKEEKIKLERDADEEAGNGRVLLWKYGVKVWEHAPLLGVGFLKGKEKALEYGYDSVYLRINGGFHNAYIEILAEFGMVGILSFVGYFIYLFIKIVQILFGNKQIDAMFLSLCAIVFSLLGYGLLEYIIICPGNYVAVTFWGILGFMNYWINAERKSR